MSSISIYFKQVKHFWLFLDLLENEDRMSGKKNVYLYYPVPVPNKSVYVRIQNVDQLIESNAIMFLYI